MQDQQLTKLVEPILAEFGLELDGLEVTPLGRRRLLRITVDGDGPKGAGPLLDDISAAASRISAALDESDSMGEAPYTLEVGSRGVSKPLTQPKHFRRNRGRLVTLWLPDGEVTGRIVKVDEDNVELDVAGSQRSIGYSDIKKAVVQVELNPPNAPAFDEEDVSDEQEQEA